MSYDFSVDCVRSALRVSGRAGLLRLVPQAEFFDDRAITFEVGMFEIFEQTPSLADFDEETTPARVIFLMSLQVLREVGDRLGQKSNLNFSRAGVVGGALEVADDRSLVFLRKCHNSDRIT